MKTLTSLVHERIDDVPLLIGLAQKLRLPELLDHHLGSHGNHRGLSIGALAAGWIAFILKLTVMRNESGFEGLQGNPVWTEFQRQHASGRYDLVTPA